MADGTTISLQTTGDKIDTEDFGTRGKAQRIKLVLGALDSDGGDITPTNPLPNKETYAPNAEDNVNNVIGTIQKPVVASQYSPIISTTAITPATKKSAKNFPGQLLSIYATNANAAVRYLLIHDKGSTPAGGDVPLLAYPIPAGTAAAPGSIKFGSSDWTENGLSMSNGVSYAISTTAASFTDAATSTDHIVNAFYI